MHLLNSPCCAASASTRCSGITNQSAPVDKIVSSPDSTDLSEDGSKLSNLQQAAASVTVSSATNEFAVSTGVQSRLPPSATTNSRTLLLAMGRKTRWICELCNIVFNSGQALGGHRSSSAEHRMRLSEAPGKVLPGRDNSGVFKDGGSSVAKRPKKQGDKKENKRIRHSEDPKEREGSRKMTSHRNLTAGGSELPSLAKMAVAEPLPLRGETAVGVERVRRDDEEGRQVGEGGTGVTVITKDVGVCARPGRRGLQMSSMIYIEAGDCGEVSICGEDVATNTASNHTGKDDISSGMHLDAETSLLLTQRAPVGSLVCVVVVVVVLCVCVCVWERECVHLCAWHACSHR